MPHVFCQNSICKCIEKYCIWMIASRKNKNWLSVKCIWYYISQVYYIQVAITNLKKGYPACIITSSLRIKAVFNCVLSRGVNVIISSGTNSLWVSVYKRIIAFSHHGHKAFTWGYGTPVGNTVYQEPHCQHITMIPYIWKKAHCRIWSISTNPSDGQTNDSATP